MENEKAELTGKLARFIVHTGVADIPSEVYEHAKVSFLDWFAVTMGGKDDPLVLKLIKFADLLGGDEQASILGHGIKKNVSLASLINGAASHALDYDDNIFFGQIPVHPSVTLFPSLLALSEWKVGSGIDFLTAYIVGFETEACVARCLDPEHYLNGWHATSTVGRLGSAAACAKLMGLDQKQTVYALGLAGTQASGMKRVFGSMTKPFHAGRASQVGLEAALLAGEGFTSAEDIMEGPAGFFKLLKGNAKDEVVGSLGKHWNIGYLAQKYHASAH